MVHRSSTALDERRAPSYSSAVSASRDRQLVERPDGRVPAPPVWPLDLDQRAADRVKWGKQWGNVAREHAEQRKPAA